MKMLAASEPEIVENLDSDNMEKLGEKEKDSLLRVGLSDDLQQLVSHLGEGQRR